MAEVITQVPTWLDKGFVEESLKIGLQNNQIQVLQYKISPGSSAGGNYVSQMFRIELKIKKSDKKNIETMSIIVKCLPTGQKLIETIREQDVFLTESLMLRKTLGEARALLKEINAEQKLAANCYFSQGPPNELIVMEDLGEKNFVLADRLVGLDKEHTELVITALAKLHASMFVLVKKNPDLTNNYLKSYWTEGNKIRLTKLINGGIRALIEEVGKWDDYSKRFSLKLELLENTFEQKVYDSYKRKDDYKWNTIVHGDPWTNNMMFNYGEDDKKVKNIVFVDFQFANLNSPVLDLMYFMFTSIQHTVRQKYLQYFLRRYHDCFTSVVARLNHDIDWSYDEFEKDFYDKIFFGLFAATIIHPIVSAPPSASYNIDDVLDLTTDYKGQNLYQFEPYQLIIKDLLPFFEEHGAL